MPSFNLFGIGIQAINPRGLGTESPEINRNYPHQIAKNHLFFLPTLGENFGHIILEAFCAGCPVLISDQTPWRDLEEKGVGWNLPLDQPELFREVLQRFAGMENAEYIKWSKKGAGLWAWGVEK